MGDGAPGDGRALSQGAADGVEYDAVVADCSGGGKARWIARAVWEAAAIFLVSLVITVRVEVPMNRAIALWDVHAIPADWMAVLDRWLQFHLGRTVGGLVAFVCGVIGLVKR